MSLCYSDYVWHCSIDGLCDTRGLSVMCQAYLPGTGDTVILSRGAVRSAASSYAAMHMVAGSRPVLVIVWEWHIGLALLWGLGWLVVHLTFVECRLINGKNDFLCLPSAWKGGGEGVEGRGVWGSIFRNFFQICCVMTSLWKSMIIGYWLKINIYFACRILKRMAIGWVVHVVFLRFFSDFFFHYFPLKITDYWLLIRSMSFNFIELVLSDCFLFHLFIA